jgi:hypothetical protein
MKTRVSVQRWDSLGGGRARIKIAEKINLTNITHNGIAYLTTKNLGRGRYIVKVDPKYVPPPPVAQDLAIPPSDDVSTAPVSTPEFNVSQGTGRTPLGYQGDAQ